MSHRQAERDDTKCLAGILRNARAVAVSAVCVILRLFPLLALELAGHPDECTEDGGAVVVGQVDDDRLDDEAAEFNEVPTA